MPGKRYRGPLRRSDVTAELEARKKAAEESDEQVFGKLVLSAADMRYLQEQRARPSYQRFLASLAEGVEWA